MTFPCVILHFTFYLHGTWPCVLPFNWSSNSGKLVDEASRGGRPLDKEAQRRQCQAHLFLDKEINSTFFQLSELIHGVSFGHGQRDDAMDMITDQGIFFLSNTTNS